MGGPLRPSKMSSTRWECHPDGSPATPPWPQGWSPGCGGRVVGSQPASWPRGQWTGLLRDRGAGGGALTHVGAAASPSPVLGAASTQQRPPRPPSLQSVCTWPPGGLSSWCLLWPTAWKTPKLFLACLPWEYLPSSGVHPPLPRGQRRASTHQRGQSRAAPVSHAQGSSQPSSWSPSWGPSPRMAPEGS